MESFSLGPLVLIAAVVLVFYFGYTKMRSTRAANIEGEGVGGWLLLLVVGLMFLGPLLGFGSIYSEFRAVEEQNRNLVTAAPWRTYKLSIWATFAVAAAISFAAGWALGNSRSRRVVRQAQIALWVAGPIAALVMALVIPFAVFGQALDGAAVVAQVGRACFVAAVWTLYLARSKRVRATYVL